MCAYVHTKLPFYIVEPNITYVSSNQKVIYDKTTTFHCNATVSAKNSPSIEWYRVHPPKHIFSRYRYNINCFNNCLLNESYVDDDSDDLCVLWSTLTIFPTHYTDGGCYICSVKDNFYTFGINRTTNLTVLCK